MRGLVAVLIGFAAAYTLSLRFFGSFVDDIATGVQATMLVLCIALLAYIILFRVLPPRLKRFRATATIALSLAALSFGIGLAGVLPTPRPVTHHLEIVATGQQNPAALGSEVWVTELRLADGTKVPSRAFTREGDWEIRDGVPISHQAQPATLRWSGFPKVVPEAVVHGTWRIQNLQSSIPAESEARVTRRETRNAALHFLSHPHSGIARITWNDHVRTVDLYSPAKTERVIPLPVAGCGAEDAAPETSAFAVRVIDALGLSLLVFVAAAIGLGRLRPVPDSQVPARRPVDLLVPAIVGVVIAAGSWAVGLRDIVHKPGELTIALDAPGADLIPLHIDEAGRHGIDIPLNRYVHEGRCAVRRETPVRAVAFVGIMDDAGTLHPPSALRLTGPVEPVTLADCPLPAVWMDAEHVRAFAFTMEYEEAHAIFFIPHGAALIDRTVDGQTETVELDSSDGELKYLSLRPAQRPPGLRTYTVALPAMRISRLRLVPPTLSVEVRVTEFRASIPGLKCLEVAFALPSVPSPGHTDQPAALELARNVRYTPTLYAQQVGAFGICAVFWALVSGAALRVWGTGWAGAGSRRRVAVWEGTVVLLSVVGALWLQTAAVGFVTNDGVSYVGHALKCITTGNVSDLVSTHPPGYSAFLAMVFVMGGEGATVWTVNAALLALGLIGAWFLGRRLGGRVAGCALVCWLAVNPILLIASRTVLPDFLYTLGVLAWFALVLAWASHRGPGSWRWALLAGLGWTVLATIRPNAVTLLAAGAVVPFLAAGMLRWRIAATACFFAVAAATHFGLKSSTSGGPQKQSMLAWGRTWPLLQRGWLAVDAPEFRPLRHEYLLARTRLGDNLSGTFFRRLRASNAAIAEMDAALRATVNASLRRWPRRAAQEFSRCVGYAYVRPDGHQLWQYLPWGFPDGARYERIFNSHAEKAGRWYDDATQQSVTSFRTEHRAGAWAWSAFRWVHARTRDWRIWPVSILALVGTVYAIRRRDGLLLLPGVLSLACTLPLCLLFVGYDRYFLPGEVLLLLQAAVGIRAIADGLRRRPRPNHAAVDAPR